MKWKNGHGGTSLVSGTRRVMVMVGRHCLRHNRHWCSLPLNFPSVLHTSFADLLTHLPSFHLIACTSDVLEVVDQEMKSEQTFPRIRRQCPPYVEVLQTRSECRGSAADRWLRPWTSLVAPLDSSSISDKHGACNALTFLCTYSYTFSEIACSNLFRCLLMVACIALSTAAISERCPPERGAVHADLRLASNHR